ncbi:MAG TPA: PLP-dependent aminotransferase family protein [Kofleriaceae bacterium]|nr:PLP-dependent aminotransferase family protein [Kofleriaceae bacterium]
MPVGLEAVVFDIDTRAQGPLFLRIAHAVAQDLARGRLRPGARLPGSRALAGSLGVHRNTVVAAYAELAAEGWVVTRAGGGTFVSDQLPEPRPRAFSRRAPRRAGVPSQLGFDLPPAREPVERWPPPGAVVLSDAVPDLRLVPHAALARAYRRAMRRTGSRLLGYSDPRGHPELRAAIAAWVSSARGIAAGPDAVIVTRGSQMSIDLVARAVLSRGETVVVEELGYQPARAALARTGARLAPVDVDGGGLDTAALARLCRRRRVRAVHVTPHHHYPTTVAMAPHRRLELLELAARHRFAVIEDDYDHEFHYDGRPILPLASADTAGVVIYVGTLSKVLAPGLRLGFAVAPPALIERLAAERSLVDRQGDQVLEAAVAELMVDGELPQHIRRMRGVYRERRDALMDSLRRRLGDSLQVDAPRGGMALWAHAPGIDVAAWKRRALAGGIAFLVASDYSFHARPAPYLRLGFAALDPDELDQAVRRMAAALP